MRRVRFCVKVVQIADFVFACAPPKSDFAVSHCLTRPQRVAVEREAEASLIRSGADQAVPILNFWRGYHFRTLGVTRLPQKYHRHRGQVNDELVCFENVGDPRPRRISTMLLSRALWMKCGPDLLSGRARFGRFSRDCQVEIVIKYKPTFVACLIRNVLVGGQEM